MPNLGAEDPAKSVTATNPDNPSQYGPEEQSPFSMSGVSEADAKRLVDIITDYRNSWAQDRLERIQQWTQNVFYWRGIQVIGWDSTTNCWYDALAFSRSQGDSGEDTDLERWINPLTLMFCNVFTGQMGRVIPKTVVKPQNADPGLKDTVTAKAAREALEIIERENQMRKLIRSIWEMLYLFGSYFRHTRAVIDGNMFGYDEEAVFEDMEIATGPHYKCPNCGMESPATSSEGTTCPNCGAFLGQESFYAAGEGNRLSLKQSGTKKIPRAGVKWTLHSPLEIDCDPKAAGDNPLSKTPILCKDIEIDFGEACRMFPKFRDSIQPGAETSTTPNAAVEKIARLDTVSALGGITADNSLANPTYSEVWMTVNSFYHPLSNSNTDWAFAERMEKQFPDGLKLSMVGEITVDIREASLTKEWSHSALYINQGVYCNALANTAVSFNARFNRTMWILDDWASRAALGLNLADAACVDTEKMSGKRVPAGTLTPVPMKVNGEPRPMSEKIMHADLPINPALWNYPMMLLTFAELIMGIPRQLAGQGTQDDVETLGGQQLQLSRASTTLKPYFENVKDEHACASSNAIYWLKKLMETGAVKKISQVIEERGGAFQNKEVDWSEMDGNVSIYQDEDQDLPVSPEELRTAVQMIFQEVSKNNPAAIAWMDVPENQNLAVSALVPGSIIPDEAQQLKTENDFQTIVDQGMQLKQGPNGSLSMQLPVHPEKYENFPIAKQIWQRSMLTHYELRIEQADKWIALNAYWEALNDADTAVGQDQAQRQMKVTAAGQPTKPGPDPQVQGEMQEVMQAARIALAKLVQFTNVDPALTGGLKDQVASAKEVVDTAVDAAKLMNGGK
jgi:hypothetical protein